MALFRCGAGAGAPSFDPSAQTAGAFNQPITIASAEVGATYIIAGAFTSTLGTVNVTGGTLIQAFNNSTGITASGGYTAYGGCVIVKATASTVALDKNGYATYTKVS